MDSHIEKWKQEIVDTEKDFAKMAAEEGIESAFLQFAAKEAVLLRDKKIIKGKTEIQKHFEGQNLDNISLQWEPDFVDVSQSGDLAYTYGKFTFSKTDTTGKKQESQGIFHTVWKRQKNGYWKFVWD